MGGQQLTTTPDIMERMRLALVTQKTPDTWPTVARDSVFMPRDWPVQDDATTSDLPIIKIQPPSEVKESKGKFGIQFDTTASIELIAEVSRKAEENDAAAGKVLTALGLIQRQIELAIIGDPILFGGDQPGLVEQLRSVNTKMATRADGKVHRGALSMTFDFVFYQGTEDFQLPVTVDVDSFHLFADLINVADPLGTYTPPMTYTPTPAPRTDGPDGRVEGEIVVDVTH